MKRWYISNVWLLHGVGWECNFDLYGQKPSTEKASEGLL